MGKSIFLMEIGFVVSSGAPVREWARNLFRDSVKTAGENARLCWLFTSKDLEIDPTDSLQADLEKERAQILRLTGPKSVVIQVLPSDSKNHLEGLLKTAWARWFGSGSPLPEIQWWYSEAPRARWAAVLFPETKACLAPDEWSAILGAYLKEVSPEEPPWEVFRFLPGFLRKTGRASASELAALEWARCQALLSPQSETDEENSLDSGEVIRNPAAQIVRLSLQGQVKAIVRIRKDGDWTLREIPLDWMDAALIDGAEESFRTPAAHLLNQVEAEYPDSSPQRKLLEKTESNAPRMTFAQKLDALIEAKLILKG